MASAFYLHFPFQVTVAHHKDNAMLYSSLTFVFITTWRHTFSLAWQLLCHICTLHSTSGMMSLGLLQ